MKMLGKIPFRPFFFPSFLNRGRSLNYHNTLCVKIMFNNMSSTNLGLQVLPTQLLLHPSIVDVAALMTIRFRIHVC